VAAAGQRDPTAVVGRRIAAFLVDVLVVAAAVLAALAVAEHRSYTGMPDDSCDVLQDFGGSDTCIQFGSRVYTWENEGVGAALIAGMLVGFANAVLLQGVTGATAGKLAVDLRTIDREGRVCGVGRALVRTLLLVFDLFACGIVGLITVTATRPHRRIGDLAAGTDVVAAADAGRPVEPRPSPVGPPPAMVPAPYAWGPPASAPARESWWQRPYPGDDEPLV
jgi:uncharacterized RDD family membrane protein YckC